MSSQAVAKGIANKARREAYKARNVHRGEVVSVKPLKIDLHFLDAVLEDDDFDLTQWVAFYDRQWGIAKGDTAVVMREGGEWSVTDIISETEVGGV